MRIISGKFKGRRIQAPKNLPSRPTTDMAKESLFNVLNNHYYLDDLSIIDLFAGTGNISLEFSSRGAKQVIAVEQNRNCIQFINKISKDLEATIDAYKSDVFKFLEKSPYKVDIVFADPPYNFSDEQFFKIVDLVFENSFLLEDGMLIIEHSKHTDLSEHDKFSFAKRYGGTVFSFFEKEA